MRRVIIIACVVSSLVTGCGWGPFTRPAPLPPGVRVDTVAGRRAAFADAYASYRRGALDRAGRIFVALVPCYPELADYDLYFAGTIDRRRGHERAAQNAFGRVLRDYPDSVEAPGAAVALGNLLVDDGRFDLGRRWLESALVAPDAGTVAAARLGLAVADERSGAITTAYAGYMQLRRSALGTPAARAAKARALALRAAHPELAPAGAALLDEARLLVAERDYGAGKDALERLVDAGAAPGVAPSDVLRVLADALKGLGQTERAVAVLRQLVERYPTDAAAPPALLQCATLLWNADRNAEALEAFTEFGARYPHEPGAAEALYAIGRIQEAADRARPALAAYAALVRLEPHSQLGEEAQWRIGWIHYLAGEWAAATAAFAPLRAGAAAERTRTGATYWQARALEGAGRRAAARRLYGAILADRPDGYYAMWAARRLGTGMQLTALPASNEPPVAPPVVVGEAPLSATFHVGRWRELRAAGVRDLARRELAAIGRQQAGDPAVTAWLLRAYQTVDGYAAAMHLLHRLGAAADVPPPARQRLLYPLAFWDVVRRATDHAVDPLLIEAVMRQESLFDPAAVSSAGARGLMQLLPATAHRVAASAGERAGALDLMEPDLNIQLGVRHLRALLDRFHGDVLKAVAAYNAGTAAVEKWQRHFADLDADELVESISYRETRAYVKQVVANYRTYRALYGGPAGP